MAHGTLGSGMTEELAGVASAAGLDEKKANYYSHPTDDYLAMVGWASFPCRKHGSHEGWTVVVCTVGWVDPGTVETGPMEPVMDGVLYVGQYKTLWAALNVFGLVAWHPQQHTALTKLGLRVVG